MQAGEASPSVKPVVSEPKERELARSEGRGASAADRLPCMLNSRICRPLTVVDIDFISGTKAPVQASSGECVLDTNKLGAQNLCQSGNGENAGFTRYVSPLLAFGSYRLSRSFGHTNKLRLTSARYANDIDPLWPLCQFESRGSCQDEKCSKQHQRDYALQSIETVQELAGLLHSAGLDLLAATAKGFPARTLLAKHLGDLCEGAGSTVPFQGIILPKTNLGLKPVPRRVKRASRIDLQLRTLVALEQSSVPQYSTLGERMTSSFKSQLLSPARVALRHLFYPGRLIRHYGKSSLGTVKLKVAEAMQNKKTTTKSGSRYFDDGEARTTSPVPSPLVPNSLSKSTSTNTELLLKRTLEVFFNNIDARNVEEQSSTIMEELGDQFDEKSEPVWYLYHQLFAHTQKSKLFKWVARVQKLPMSHEVCLQLADLATTAEKSVAVLETGIVHLCQLKSNPLPQDRAEDWQRVRCECVLDLALHVLRRLHYSGKESELLGWVGNLVDMSQSAHDPIYNTKAYVASIARCPCAVAMNAPLSIKAQQGLLGVTMEYTHCACVLWLTVAYIKAFGHLPPEVESRLRSSQTVPVLNWFDSWKGVQDKTKVLKAVAVLKLGATRIFAWELGKKREMGAEIVSLLSLQALACNILVIDKILLLGLPSDDDTPQPVLPFLYNFVNTVQGDSSKPNLGSLNGAGALLNLAQSCEEFALYYEARVKDLSQRQNLYHVGKNWAAEVHLDWFSMWQNAMLLRRAAEVVVRTQAPTTECAHGEHDFLSRALGQEARRAAAASCAAVFEDIMRVEDLLRCDLRDNRILNVVEGRCDTEEIPPRQQPHLSGHLGPGSTLFLSSIDECFAYVNSSTSHWLRGRPSRAWKVLTAGLQACPETSLGQLLWRQCLFMLTTDSLAAGKSAGKALRFDDRRAGQFNSEGEEGIFCFLTWKRCI